MTKAPVSTWSSAVLYSAIHDMVGGVACDLCPYRCRLAVGETGRCQVRRNHNGVLQTSTYSVAVAHLDAIERKPLYHFRPGTKVLTLGTPGCTFSCSYCLNHGLSQVGRPGVAWLGSAPNLDEYVRRAEEDDAALGMSYAEPGLAPELALDLFDRAKAVGIPVVWKTNGFLTRSAIDRLAPGLSAVNIDIKAVDDESHRRLTGAPLQPVLDAIEAFRSHGVWVEVATPVAPGIVDNDEQIDRLGKYLAAIDPSIPWHLLRFTPDYRMTRPPPTSVETLDRARQLAFNSGLQYVYVERALGSQGQRTNCPSCHSTVVERKIWSVESNLMVDGKCSSCGYQMEGRWQ